MDSLVTILIYVGAFILISVAKSISSSAKKKEGQRAHQTRYSEEEYLPEQDSQFESGDDGYAQFLRKMDIGMPYGKSDELFEEGQRVFLSGEEEKSSYSEDETEFILGDFDLKSAIVYSEILKRSDY